MVIALPTPRISRDQIRRAARKLRDRLARYARPARVPLRNLVSAPLFAAGILFFDVGVFQWSHRVGWMVTGLSLMVLEHVIADED